MRKIIIIISILLTTSCTAVKFPAQSIVVEETTESAARRILPSPTLSLPTITVIPASTITAIPTETFMAGIPPTETEMPPLELPTPLANLPALFAWDGAPTYVGDSKPGYFFRVRYDPEIWALTTDSYGYPAIGNRSIEYCVIAPGSGHGLPASMSVDHESKKIGALDFEINTVYLNGERQFVTYIGGDLNIYTGFEVTFKENADLCLQEAETVFATLVSVRISQATPLP